MCWRPPGQRGPGGAKGQSSRVRHGGPSMKQNGRNGCAAILFPSPSRETRILGRRWNAGLDWWSHQRGDFRLNCAWFQGQARKWKAKKHASSVQIARRWSHRVEGKTNTRVAVGISPDYITRREMVFFRPPWCLAESGTLNLKGGLGKLTCRRLLASHLPWGIGQATRSNGTSHLDGHSGCQYADSETKGDIMMGEIWRFRRKRRPPNRIKKNCKTRWGGFIRGQHGRRRARMGHRRGAIVSGGKATGGGEIEAFRAAGIGVRRRTVGGMADTLLKMM